MVTKKLLALQRGFALKITRGFRTLNTIDAITLAGLTPLHLKAQETATIELTRITYISPFLPTDITMDTPTHSSQLIHPAHRISHAYHTVDNQEEHNTTLLSLSHTHSHHIYTDGSKHDNRVGAAVIIQTPTNCTITKKHSLHPTCSVFQAELLALSKACQWLADNHVYTAAIMSDSRSALDDIRNTASTHTLTNHIQTFLSQTHINISLVWVKAHGDILGNELADIAAKEAANKHTTPAFLHFPL
ncbi:uncharacterized protein LOC142985952 [Anticarsia gemmatalis]|uniref:uncharacterized protein LOC142985952 n=1 Tax=Anticarsia gemmatalis TaxID=129554 RepID=UPI003F76C274